MENIRRLRGFRDILGEEMERFRRIEEAMRKHLRLFGFQEIQIPVLEKTELFVRSIGDTTDIVEKEMFTFRDLGGDSLTLRPEATAGMVRSYLEESMYARERVTKVFTVGPMFRHERPQKGRFRQFHQVDVEVFGAGEALADAELVLMISLVLAQLGVEGYEVEVNSVGCPLCRQSFRKTLVEYLDKRREELCGDCLRRLDRNPLRIFDCKNEGCARISLQSPVLSAHLCPSCATHFEMFLDSLKGFGIGFTVNERLVRGLDYYTRTVFEVTAGELGAQKAFVAGGRYDGLVAEMGGPSTPATGFAVGMERLALLVKGGAESGAPVLFFAYVGEKAQGYLVPMVDSFARAGLTLRYAYDRRSLKSQMRYADSLRADYVLILGDDEIAKGVIILRDMKKKIQQELILEPAGIPREFLSLSIE